MCQHFVRPYDEMQRLLLGEFRAIMRSFPFRSSDLTPDDGTLVWSVDRYHLG